MLYRSLCKRANLELIALWHKASLAWLDSVEGRICFFLWQTKIFRPNLQSQSNRNVLLKVENIKCRDRIEMERKLKRFKPKFRLIKREVKFHRIRTLKM